MSMVLGYRPTAQTHCNSCHELERGARELKEEAAMFQPTEPMGNGTPMPFLVNPQTDTPLTYVRQTVKRAIDFTRDSDLWRDDTTSPSRQCQTGAMQLKHEFHFADGRRTATASDSASVQGSFSGPAEEIDETTIAQL